VNRQRGLVVLSAVLAFALSIPACQGNTRQLPYNGTYGFRIVLENNPDAVDPTWEQVVAFLKADRTDEMEYVASDFMCGSFAQEVHNNAEKAGIRAAWVGIDLAGKSATPSTPSIPPTAAWFTPTRRGRPPRRTT
jgi:hypothetical protein